MKVIIKPNSCQDGDKWIPEGMVSLLEGLYLTEGREECKNVKFDNKEEANKYFKQVCIRKYRIMD